MAAKKKKKGQVGQSLFFNLRQQNIHGFTKQEFGNESSIMSWLLGMTGWVARFEITNTFLSSTIAPHECRKSRKDDVVLVRVIQKIFYPRVLVVSSACCVFAHV